MGPVLHIAYVALGSNVGDRLSHLLCALGCLAADPAVAILRVSTVFETEPQDVIHQPLFLNLVASIRTAYKPWDLLVRLQDIEQAGGRVRTEALHRGPRTVDLDILLFADLVLDDVNLTVPHPRMGSRRFVLEPLVEVAPDLANPITGGKWTERLPDVSEQGLRPYCCLLGYGRN